MAKTRLGLVLKGYPRISETFISNEIRLLEEQGFDIHIFSMRQPRESFSHESVKQIRAEVTYLPHSMLLHFPLLLWHTLRYAFRHPDRFSKSVKLLLSRYALAPKKHTWLKHLMQACFVANKAMHMDIAHLHAHFAHTPTTVAMYSAILLDIPFSFTAHAKDIYTQDPARVAEKIERASFAVTCTGYNKEQLEAMVEGRRPVHCVYHGIDLTLFNGNGRSTQAAPPYHIITAARLVEKKGYPYILKALHKLKEQDIDFQHTIVGTGPEKDAIVALAKELDIADRITFTGTITHDEVKALYAKADLFLIGCIEARDGDRDGIPNVIAESMAMGVPVVATTTSGIPELVENGTSGLLVRPHDHEALAEAAKKLLTDQSLRSKIIPAARKRVRTVFDNVKLIKELGNIYAEHGIPRSNIRQ